MDIKAIEKATYDLLKALGENPDREGLKETPHRVAKYYEELMEGIQYTNEEIAQKFNKCFSVTSNDIVFLKDIPCFSFCEHHIALMYDMRIAVAYIPNGKVIGLSKIPRICDMVCKRLQIQERIGSDIAEVITLATGSNDVAVFITAKHSCVTARGIKKPCETTTSTLRGNFIKNASLRNEILQLLKL